jgi:hypothetical protein
MHDGHFRENGGEIFVFSFQYLDIFVFSFQYLNISIFNFQYSNIFFISL